MWCSVATLYGDIFSGHHIACLIVVQCGSSPSNAASQGCVPVQCCASAGRDPNFGLIHCAAVEDRIAKWTMVPVANGEGIQVLRYEPTEK